MLKKASRDLLRRLTCWCWGFDNMLAYFNGICRQNRKVLKIVVYMVGNFGLSSRQKAVLIFDLLIEISQTQKWGMPDVENRW